MASSFILKLFVSIVVIEVALVACVINLSYQRLHEQRYLQVTARQSVVGSNSLVGYMVEQFNTAPASTEDLDVIQLLVDIMHELNDLFKIKGQLRNKSPLTSPEYLHIRNKIYLFVRGLKRFGNRERTPDEEKTARAIQSTILRSVLYQNFNKLTQYINNDDIQIDAKFIYIAFDEIVLQ